MYASSGDDEHIWLNPLDNRLANLFAQPDIYTELGNLGLEVANQT